MYLVGFPLLLIPFALYNIVALLMPGVSWAEAVTRLRLPSGGEWTMSLGDMLVALSIFLLLIEIIKAYRHGGRYFVDHALSILLLLVMAAEFYLFPRAATAPFFLMMVASLADVVGGLVAMRRRRAPAATIEDDVADAPVKTEPPMPPDIEPAARPEKRDPVIAVADPIVPSTPSRIVNPTDTSPSPVVAAATTPDIKPVEFAPADNKIDPTALPDAPSRETKTDSVTLPETKPQLPKSSD